MSLPFLINNSDCGPVNPLSGLVKNVDRDRGVQQDHFGGGRAGSSREAFRTPQAISKGLNQEVSQFFDPQAGPSSATAVNRHAGTAFDLSALHTSLPQGPVAAPVPQSIQTTPGLSWAADFLNRHHGQLSSPGPSAQALSSPRVLQPLASQPMQTPSPGLQAHSWASPMQSVAQPSMWMPQTPLSQQAPASKLDRGVLEQQFQSHEAAVATQSSGIPAAVDIDLMKQRLEEISTHKTPEQDELARTAHLLIESVKHEQNPKFHNSEFLKLMRQLRDGSMTVDGNDMVAREAMVAGSQVDGKGKGKEVAPGDFYICDPSTSSTTAHMQRRKSVHFEREEPVSDVQGDAVTEDPNDAYFRQENEDFIKYWNNTLKEPPPQTVGQGFAQSEWGILQDQWDSFEATATGVKPVQLYPFIRNNPYLEGSTSGQYAGMHRREALYDSVLELEAKVQRDMQNARAWYELGIKEQESEREHKAVMALRRALELDPSHLESRLALAISLTNEGNIIGADEEVIEWIRRNERYAEVVKTFNLPTQVASTSFAQHSEVHRQLIDCLIAMARSRTDVIDADVQIALAALLNASEEYEKAHDCFRTALAVRPDDWQLYNRVGATLANSGNAEAALEYYYRALALNPGYIRARFNLGISCMNMKRYDEAAEHLLNALLLQESDNVVSGDGMDDRTGVTSNSLWESMKTACVQSQRLDLAMLCSHRNLEELRKAFSA